MTNILDDHIKDVLAATGLFGIISKVELYKKVILAYDPDQDERLKEVVERVTTYFRHDLLAVHECDGALTMIWKTKVPEPFLPGNSIATTCSDGSLDHWVIVHSVTSKSIEQKHRLKKLEVLGLSDLSEN
jgi:hypothetical protein